MSVNDEEILALCRELVEHLNARAKEITTSSTRGYVPVLLTLLRPYLRTVCAEIDEDAATVSPGDGRAKPFDVDIIFWDKTDDAEAPDKIAEADTERVISVAGVMGYIASMIDELHAEDGGTPSEEAGLVALTRRAPSLRTSLGRGNGVGQVRVDYTVGEETYHAHATVRRVESS